MRRPFWRGISRIFRDLAFAASVGLEGRELVAWLDRLDEEVDNLRAALDWAFETDVPAALEMLMGLSGYWSRRAIGPEGSAWLQRAVDALATLPPPEDGDRAKRLSMESKLKAAAAANAISTGRNAERAAEWATDAMRLGLEIGDTS